MIEVLQTIAGIFGILSLFFIIMWFAVIRKEVAIGKVERKIQKEALNGNKIAIALIKERHVSYKNIPTMLEALKGNKNALEMLRIENYIQEITHRLEKQ